MPNIPWLVPISIADLISGAGRPNHGIGREYRSSSLSAAIGGRYHNNETLAVSQDESARHNNMTPRGLGLGAPLPCHAGTTQEHTNILSSA